MTEHLKKISYRGILLLCLFVIFLEQFFRDSLFVDVGHPPEGILGWAFYYMHLPLSYIALISVLWYVRFKKETTKKMFMLETVVFALLSNHLLLQIEIVLLSQPFDVIILYIVNILFTTALVYQGAERNKAARSIIHALMVVGAYGVMFGVFWLQYAYAMGY